jgi:hypothetical protein
MHSSIDCQCWWGADSRMVYLPMNLWTVGWNLYFEYAGLWTCGIGICRQNFSWRKNEDAAIVIFRFSTARQVTLIHRVTCYENKFLVLSNFIYRSFSLMNGPIMHINSIIHDLMNRIDLVNLPWPIFCYYVKSMYLWAKLNRIIKPSIYSYNQIFQKINKFLLGKVWVNLEEKL